MIFVGIDIANCSATREDKRRQEEDKTRSQSPATEFRGVWPGVFKIEPQQ